MNAAPAPVERKVAREAAQWFFRLQANGVSEEDRLACAAWRREHQEHERAWQLAVRFSDQVQAIPSTIGRATLQRSATMDRRTALKALTSLVVLGSLSVGAMRSGTFDRLTADVSTAIGEMRHLTLEDGTEIHLNTDTALDIRYSDTMRLLVLRKGELYVSTARDPRPLQLQSPCGQFQPLGTRFILRGYDDHDRLSVIEGAVAATPVENSAASQQINAGEQATVTSRQVTRLPGAPVATAWTRGVLRTNRMRLEDVIEELGRYRSGWTRCAPEVADLQVSGTFQLSNIDAALDALAMTFPVRVRYITRYWVTIGPV